MVHAATELAKQAMPAAIANPNTLLRERHLHLVRAAGT